MLHCYQVPTASNIWECRLKHQQPSQWVSSLTRCDERSRCLPPTDGPPHWPVTLQCACVMICQAHNVNAMTGEPSGRSVLSHQVQDSRSIVCRQSTVLLLNSTTFQGNKGLIQVLCLHGCFSSWSGHLFLLSVSAFPLLVSCFSQALFSRVSFGFANCLDSALSSLLLSKRFQSGWHKPKREQTVLRPYILSQGWHPFFSWEKLTKDFFFKTLRLSFTEPLSCDFFKIVLSLLSITDFSTSIHSCLP